MDNHATCFMTTQRLVKYIEEKNNFNMNERISLIVLWTVIKLNSNKKYATISVTELMTRAIVKKKVNYSDIVTWCYIIITFNPLKNNYKYINSLLML